MIQIRKAITTITFLALGLLAFSSAQAKDVFKGSAQGDATFGSTTNSDDGSGTPDGSFGTVNAVGQITHTGKTSVVLAMKPSGETDGTRGFSGTAVLIAANGDEIDMDIVTGAPTITESADRTTATAVYVGTSKMTGGTGRFDSASLASKVSITITCNFSTRVWTITIKW